MKRAGSPAAPAAMTADVVNGLRRDSQAGPLHDPRSPLDERGKQRAHRPFHESTVDIGKGRELGYAEFGAPDGDVVLWCHSTPGARRQIPPGLEEAALVGGFRLIGIDRPGTGASTPHTYPQVADWAADVERLTDALSIDRFALIGLSGGGPFVLAACHGLPDRVVAGAVLGGIGPTRGAEAAPGITRLLPLGEPFLRVTERVVGPTLTAAVRAMRRVGSPAYDLYGKVAPFSDRAVLALPEVKDVLLNDLMHAAKTGLRAPVSDVLVFSRPWGFSLADISVPVRFWHGDGDGVIPLSHGELQADLIPGAELVVCPDGGHFAGWMLGRDVIDWIRDIWVASVD